MTVPALMISFDRRAYTQKALEALVSSDAGQIYLIDNGSTEQGMDSYLQFVIDYFADNERIIVIRNQENYGIAFAMNQFLDLTGDAQYCIKVDSDTIIPTDFCERMLPHMEHADLVQARHEIIKATNPDGWEGFTRGMKRKGNLLFNHYVGGSGIFFKRKLVELIPETENKIQGWRQWQREHPEIRKAFAEDIEIDLLDGETHGGYPTEYEKYYKNTGRL